MAGDDVVRRALTVRQWQTIDGTLDNLASTEQVDGDLAKAEHARRIRAVGWAVLRSHPQAGLGSVGWPPDDSRFEVALPQEDWDFVTAAVTRSSEVGRELLGDPRLHAAVRAEQAASVALEDDVLRAL
jgi:hypothetical protein